MEGGGHYTDILPQELNTMLQNKDFFFVNVHIPYEGEIEKTDAFIPFDQTEARLSEYPQARDAKIVVYCRSGSMSATAARDLVKAGYANVYNLDGGFRAWEDGRLRVAPEAMSYAARQVIQTDTADAPGDRAGRPLDGSGQGASSVQYLLRAVGCIVGPHRRRVG